MPDIVGIRFKSCGKIYDFEVNGSGEEFKRGECVIVESDLGLSIGSVVTGRHTVENPGKELRRVLRKATEEDFKRKQDNESFENEARDYCLERILARGLPMKLVSTEATLDKKRIIFYFTADGRIDFREIVKDLAAKFKTRIEMRQIGVRDEAKIVGGFGMCGRELCCKTFLTSFEPISIKMAKQQELVLNMSKLSGICGRLMCCLGYEVAAESDEETSEAASGGDMAITAEEAVSTEAVEEKPQPEVPVPAPQSKEPISSEAHQNATPPRTEGAEQKQGQGHRKRKKWRWRKFQKHDKPENKQQ
ncbi:MAG: stage 0 sporulation family protein [Nitrospirota bacterium]